MRGRNEAVFQQAVRRSYFGNFAVPGVISSYRRTTRAGQNVINDTLALLVDGGRAASSRRERTTFTTTMFLQSASGRT